MRISDQDLQVILNNKPQTQPNNAQVNAAVALIMREAEHGTEFLLMQRSHHDKDPWSGQMSFPGGKIDTTDESAKDAAIRESKEEVNLSLTDEEYIGYLGDIYGFKVDGVYKVKVSCFVFKTSGELALQGNEEVADLVWVPFATLSDPSKAHFFYHPSVENNEMPAVWINPHKQQLLWGLTLRLMIKFHDLLGHSMSIFNPQQIQQLRDLDKLSLSSQQFTEMQRSRK